MALMKFELLFLNKVISDREIFMEYKFKHIWRWFIEADSFAHIVKLVKSIFYKYIML